LGVARGAIKTVRVAAVARIGRDGERLLAGGIVQRVVQPRDHAHRIPERRMRRHILDALAVNPDLPTVTNALDVFSAGERARAFCGHDDPSSSLARCSQSAMNRNTFSCGGWGENVSS